MIYDASNGTQSSAPAESNSPVGATIRTENLATGEQKLAGKSAKTLSKPVVADSCMGACIGSCIACFGALFS